MKFAFNHALRNLGEFLPSVRELRGYSEQWNPEVIADSRHILERGGKPPDWEPLKPEELQQMRQEAARRVHEIKQQIADVAKEHEIPKLDPAEWDARRKRQLREFRTKNGLTGEV